MRSAFALRLLQQSIVVLMDWVCHNVLPRAAAAQVPRIPLQRDMLSVSASDAKLSCDYF